MPTLTPEGRRLVQDLARRHGFGEDAVTRMLAAVAAGHGRMAQFAHPEFGGSGQWMSGGMLMLGDMFDHALKSRVGALCTDLSNALASIEPRAAPAPSRSQSQSQNRGGNDAADLLDTPFFTPTSSSSWWPDELGVPSATGSQSSMRYAYFADAHRLAVDADGDVAVHDTLEHRIGGFSQQQGGGDGLAMTSQHGTLDLATLPIVSRDGPPRPSPSPQPLQPSSAAPEPVSAPARSDAAQPGSDAPSSVDLAASAGAAKPSGPAGAAHEDPLQLIERLGQLHERGLLTDEEFSAKKGELLSRL